MTRRSFVILSAGAGALARAQPAPRETDTVLRVMRDELERSRSLRIVSLDGPYFIEYAVHDSGGLVIVASLGALTSVVENRSRYPRIRVRVGDYQFDDGNYVLSGGQFGARYDLGPFPVDDDYTAMRQYFWLATDSAYKSALEVIARKRAALKNVNASDQLPDFSKAEATSLVLAKPALTLRQEPWKSQVRGLSALFASHPRITDSRVLFEAGQGSFYLANSEGTVVRVPENAAMLEIRASAPAPDGMLVRDAVSFHAHEVDELPAEAELRRGAETVAANVEALLDAPRGDAYLGPVLFEPTAAAQFMAELLGRNLALRRRFVSEPGRPTSFVASEMEGRLGSRILPDWMDVVDDPTATAWQGRPLFGRYLVDLEGVVPKPLVIVEKGVLRSYLMTRQPMRGAEGSNGRARLIGGLGANAASFSSLFVRATGAVAAPELKKQLLDLARQRNLPYGILIRKMDYPSTASMSEYRRMLSRASTAGGGGRPVSQPLLAYRVYADGREELVRGLWLKGVQVRTLRDIVAAGGEPAVFEYQENGAPFALTGAGNFVAESSVIAPGLLFEELQLERAEEDLPTLPIVPAPSLTAPR